MDSMMEESSFWGLDLELPEDPWTIGLSDNGYKEEVRCDEALKFEQSCDPLWKESEPIQTFSLGPELLDDDCWLDQRIDIGAVLDQYIQSPEFDAVFSEIGDSEDFIKSMDLNQAPLPLPPPEEEEEKINEEVLINIENEVEQEVEIETNEVTVDETRVIYLEPSSPSSSLLPSSDYRIIITPSTSLNSTDDVVAGPSYQVIKVEEDATPSCSSQEPAGKTRRGRKKMRSEPYSSSKEESSSSCDSSPASPSSFSEMSSDASYSPQSGGRVGERKERKKHQNRTAATKYRQKKKAESETVSQVEEELLSKNKEMKEKVASLTNEIGYLKGLMREMLVAKGALKNS